MLGKDIISILLLAFDFPELFRSISREFFVRFLENFSFDFSRILFYRFVEQPFFSDPSKVFSIDSPGRFLLDLSKYFSICQKRRKTGFLTLINSKPESFVGRFR